MVGRRSLRSAPCWNGSPDMGSLWLPVTDNWSQDSRPSRIAAPTVRSLYLVGSSSGSFEIKLRWTPSTSANPFLLPKIRIAINLLNTASNESIRTRLLKGRRGDVLRLLLEGFSPNEIADVLPIGKKYVDKKIAEIKSILGVKTHIRILRACIELGITKL